MIRDEQKAYNAENYPASVLTWLNEATDRAYNDFESRTCENCKHLNEFDRCVLNVQNGSPICNGEVIYKMKDFGCNKFKRKTLEN